MPGRYFARYATAGGGRERAITPDGVYKLVRRYSAALGFEIGAQALRATAAANALDHEADIAKVQEWLGHSGEPASSKMLTSHGSPRTPVSSGCASSWNWRTPTAGARRNCSGSASASAI